MIEVPEPALFIMNDTTRIGNDGEEAAAAWLLEQGFRLLRRNWRAGRYELDIVAEKEGTLHIVEVKTRRREGLTSPEEALDARKVRALVSAARAYLRRNPHRGEVQFDLMAVETRPGEAPELRLIEHAVELHW